MERRSRALADAATLGRAGTPVEVAQRGRRGAGRRDRERRLRRRREVAQAVSVAAAYFEDTLAGPPEVVAGGGDDGRGELAAMLHANGLEGLRVREMMEPGMLEAGAATASVPRGWLAGVKGALTN